jgi:hypothetical protein
MRLVLEKSSIPSRCLETVAALLGCGFYGLLTNFRGL